MFNLNEYNTACFTGHRPNKLAGGYDYYSAPNIVLGKQIRSAVLDLITNHNTKHFICGGAIGVDQMAFMVLQKLKLTYPDITVELAVPFKQQYIKWSTASQNTHHKHVQLADTVTYVDLLSEYTLPQHQPDIYHIAKMQQRNQYMVDNSQYVIAVWDGTAGGTKNCIDYARANDKSIIRITPIK